MQVCDLYRSIYKALATCTRVCFMGSQQQHKETYDQKISLNLESSSTTTSYRYSNIVNKCKIVLETYNMEHNNNNNNL